MIEALLRDLRQPEYVHTLLNPLPIYGLGLAFVGLLFAIVLRSRGGQVTALGLIFISALSVWPVIHYGERAQANVLAMSDADGRAWLEAHEARAEKLELIFYALAAVSLAAIFAPKQWPKTALPLAIATLLMAIGALGAGASIAYAGGKIRHKEFRTVPPPESPVES
ncbi:hypothetical protein BH18VER1_BH18VER1_05350 [soil metagenome]